jgi:radical SAM superfamily enzyme YgiQ (UPF0313 family)
MPPAIGDSLRLRLSAPEALIPSVAADMGNPPWKEAQGRILILRLSPFADVSSSTSHLVLFAECRKALASAYIDFGFFPDRRDRSILAAEGAPFFYGLASGQAPEDFDLILVSNSFALELLNLSYLYAAMGDRGVASAMPSRASERAAASASGREWPIVILGGSNAALSGSLLLPGSPEEESSDCLADAIYFGEGEGALGETARAGTMKGKDRKSRLERLGSVEGLWVALSGKKASRRTAKPYPPPLCSYPVLNSSVASTAKLQISAGCPGFCSFCLEGWESRPYRELPLDEILKSARELKARSGASCLEVYSYNFNTHGRVYDLIFELGRIFRRVNFMSQRLDILAEAPELVRTELSADKRSFTLGIEGISERMRAYYRKGVDQGQIEAAAKLLLKPAIRELKLFYILSGLEEESDVAELAAFASWLSEIKEREAPGTRILVSAGYLARLPFTPLQYAPLCLDRDKLELIASRARNACAAAGLEFRLAVDFEEYYIDQVLVLGGRALGPWLEATAAADIAYDGGPSKGAASSLKAFAERGGLLDSFFLSEKEGSWRPPLSFQDENFEALHNNYSLASSFTPKEGRLPVPAYTGIDRQLKLERLMEAKHRFSELYVLTAFPPELAGSTEEYRASWLLRRLYAASGDLAVFDAEDALFAKGESAEGFARSYFGKACYRLLGPDSSKLALAAKAAGFEALAKRPAIEGIVVELSLPSSFAREAEAALRAYLEEERISFIEKKDGRTRVFEPSARDLKKKRLIEARLSNDEVSFNARLSLGSKARVEPILLCMPDEAQRGSRLCIAEIELAP